MLMPRAYIAMILSSKPVKRHSPVAIGTGSNVPSRSRGTSMSRRSSSVVMRLRLVPLRWFVLLAGLASPFSFLTSALAHHDF
jgi:hypothetical protein